MVLIFVYTFEQFQEFHNDLNELHSHEKHVIKAHPPWEQICVDMKVILSLEINGI